MRPQRAPTDSENATHRLFFRFFLCFLLVAPLGWAAASRGMCAIDPQAAGRFGLLFVLLAFAGGLSLLTRPYLLLLSAAKALHDAALLYRLTEWTQIGAIGIFYWNLGLLLTVLSLVLFAVAAARAELFAFVCVKRDAGLLFSREMGAYLLGALLPVALSVTLYFLWPRLCAAMGMHPVPLN